MKKNTFTKKIFTRSIEGSAIAISFLLVIGIAYAFSTWNSGLAPQASPENGNVQLATGGTTTTNNTAASGLYGVCSLHWTYTQNSNGTMRREWIDGCRLLSSNNTDIIRCIASGDATPRSLMNSMQCSLATFARCSCSCASGYTLVFIGGPDNTQYETQADGYRYACMKN